MKILLVNNFAHFEGGSARYILDLYDLLKAHGHEVAFFAMRPGKEEEALVREDIYEAWGKYWVSHVRTRKAEYTWQGIRTAFRYLWSFEAGKSLSRLISDFHPDIVHFNSLSHQIPASIIPLVSRARIPMVMTVHDYGLVYPDYALSVNHLREAETRRFLPVVYRRQIKDSIAASGLSYAQFMLHRSLRLYHHINVLIAPSRFMQSLLDQAGFSKTFHLPNFYPLNTGATDEQVRVGSDLIYVARLSPEKGVLQLIEAYRRCLSIDPHLPKLVFYSRTGPLLDTVDRLTQEGELKGKFERRPFRGLESFSQIFTSARAVMIPSFPYLENFPYAVLEAFSYGRPVLTSGLGGLSEMVENGMTGWNVLEQTENVSREEYIRRLSRVLLDAAHESDDALQRMGKKGYDYVSRLTPRWYYGEIMKVYQNLELRNKD